MKGVSKIFNNHIESHLFWGLFRLKHNMKTQIDLEMANTLFIDELKEFRIKSQKIEQQINPRTVFSQDITTLQDYVSDIGRLIKILKMKRQVIKKEINEFKQFTSLLEK